jgi:hypothetical protein
MFDITVSIKVCVSKIEFWWERVAERQPHTRCIPVVKGCVKPEGLIIKEATDFAFQVWLAFKAVEEFLVWMIPGETTVIALRPLLGVVEPSANPQVQATNRPMSAGWSDSQLRQE